MQVDTLQLHKQHAALLVIDLQEKNTALMPESRMFALRKNVRKLIEGARAFGMPVFVTEQYPKGLGSTLDDLSRSLTEGAKILEKESFSCCGAPAFMEALKDSKRNQVIVCGIEAHVSVFQTARDLVRRHFGVFIAEDAIASRSHDNLQVGIRLMERAGVTISSTDTMLLDLLQKVGGPDFKAISRLVK